MCFAEELDTESGRRDSKVLSLATEIKEVIGWDVIEFWSEVGEREIWIVLVPHIQLLKRQTDLGDWCSAKMFRLDNGHKSCLKDIWKGKKPVLRWEEMGRTVGKVRCVWRTELWSDGRRCSRASDSYWEEMALIWRRVNLVFTMSWEPKAESILKKTDDHLS